ncbi:hypothetical protein NMY22_g15719 [Coprinellus aureogranulatus]|nr:hypothetical protein NMY22_g15719 [Coprinellus aureogranulatus]
MREAIVVFEEDGEDSQLGPCQVPAIIIVGNDERDPPFLSTAVRTPYDFIRRVYASSTATDKEKIRRHWTPVPHVPPDLLDTRRSSRCCARHDSLPVLMIGVGLVEQLATAERLS